MKMGIAAMQLAVMHKLDVNFNETWSAIGEDLQSKLLRGTLEYLKFLCDYSDFHQSVYAMLLRIFQNLIPNAENSAWEILHQFILDETLPIAGQKNAVWIILGLIGRLLGCPSYEKFVNDCIYMLLKNMTTGVMLDHASLNINYYENLDVNSAAKQPGIGYFALLGTYLPFLWPICCRQLQRLMNEENGLLKTLKILIGFIDSNKFIRESTQDCDDFVENVLEQARANLEINLSHYVEKIQRAFLREVMST